MVRHAKFIIIRILRLLLFYLPTIVPYNIGPGMKATRAITTSEKPNDSDLSSCFTHLNSENVYTISRLRIKELKVKVKLLLTKFHNELLYLNLRVKSFSMIYNSNLLFPYFHFIYLFIINYFCFYLSPSKFVQLNEFSNNKKTIF